MPISSISQAGSLHYKLQNLFSAGNEEKLSAMDVKGLPAISSLQQAPYG
jgi:hypothetical protein